MRGLTALFCACLQVPFRDRLLYTLGAAVILMSCSNIQLVGVNESAISSKDPLYWTRTVLASAKRGTLMDLGIFPVLTSGLMLQMLAGTRMIEVNRGLKEDRALFSGAHKVFGVLCSFIAGAMMAFSGLYGPLSLFVKVLVTLQLTAMGLIVVMIDQLIQKGFGIGAGMTLYIAVASCGNIIWGAFSPIMHTTGRGKEFEGAIFALFHLLLSQLSSPLLSSSPRSQLQMVNQLTITPTTSLTFS